MEKRNKKITIFVSSSSDAYKERFLIKRIIINLKRKYAQHIDIIFYFWEKNPQDGSFPFSESIPSPAEFDICICLFWTRIGTILKTRYGEAFESKFITGTIKEFEEAKNSKNTFLLVYRNFDSIQLDSNKRKEYDKQAKMLDYFAKKFLTDKKGRNKTAYKEFSTKHIEEKLSTLVEEDLETLIIKRIQKINQENPPEIIVNNPYPDSFKPYDKHMDENLFEGRKKDIKQLKDQIILQIEKENSFLMIVGPSGCGKSSLLNIGSKQIKESLELKFNTENLKIINITLSKNYNELSKDFHLNLKKELKDNNKDKHVNFNHSERNSNTINYIKDWVKSIPSNSKYLLLLDQFEEIFFINSKKEPLLRNNEEIETFLELLTDISKTGKVWIISSMRSDFYKYVSMYKLLNKLMKTTGTLTLSFPSISEYSNIIELPVLRTGNTFQINESDGIPLNKKIEEDIKNNNTALPFITLLLHELYEKDKSKKMMTYDSYEKLGGIEGFIKKKIKKIYKKLKENKLEKKFEILLMHLVYLHYEETFNPINKKVNLSLIQEDSNLYKVAEILIKERFLITDNNFIFISHESLFIEIPEIKTVIEKKENFIKLVPRITMMQKKWDEEKNKKEKKNLFLGKKELIEATEIMQTYPFLLKEDIDDKKLENYIVLSQKHYRNNYIKMFSFISLSIIIILFLIYDNLRSKSIVIKKQNKLVNELGFFYIREGDKLREKLEYDKAKLYYLNAFNYLYDKNKPVVLDKLSLLTSSYTYKIPVRYTDFVLTKDNKFIIAAKNNELFLVDAITGKTIKKLISILHKIKNIKLSNSNYIIITSGFRHDIKVLKYNNETKTLEDKENNFIYVANKSYSNTKNLDETYARDFVIKNNRVYLVKNINNKDKNINILYLDNSINKKTHTIDFVKHPNFKDKGKINFDSPIQKMELSPSKKYLIINHGFFYNSIIDLDTNKEKIKIKTTYPILGKINKNEDSFIYIDKKGLAKISLNKNNKIKQTYLYNPQNIKSINISQDNKYIILTYKNLDIKIFDFEKLKELKSYKDTHLTNASGHKKVILSNDNKYFYTLSHESLKKWPINKKSLNNKKYYDKMLKVSSFNNNKRNISITISKDSKYIFIGTANGEIQFINFKTKKVEKEFKEKGMIRQLYITKNNKYLIYSTWRHNINILDIKKKTKVYTKDISFDSFIISPDEKELFTFHNHKGTRIKRTWKLNVEDEEKMLEGNKTISSHLFINISHKNYILSRSNLYDDWTITNYNKYGKYGFIIKNKTIFFDYDEINNPNFTNSISRHKNNKEISSSKNINHNYFLTTSYDKTMLLWDSKLEIPIKIFYSDSAIWDTAISNDRKYILTSSYNGEINILDFNPIIDYEKVKISILKEKKAIEKSTNMQIKNTNLINLN